MSEDRFAFRIQDEYKSKAERIAEQTGSSVSDIVQAATSYRELKSDNMYEPLTEGSLEKRITIRYSSFPGVEDYIEDAESLGLNPSVEMRKALIHFLEKDEVEEIL